MRDLDLLEQYLVRLRQDSLLESHQALIVDNYTGAKEAAVRAELVDRIRAALKELASDSGDFIKRYLQ